MKAVFKDLFDDLGAERKKFKVAGNHECNMYTFRTVVSEVSSFVGNPVPTMV